jgi:AcrR family transcriptional regulator
MSTHVREAVFTAAPEASADDAKRARILQAGMKAFLAYGYSRVTMDQIAQTAEMSRPALYLVFKNKADIYRALAAKLVGESFHKARIALAADGTFGDRINAAVDTCMISNYADIAASPHGAEILDAKSTLCKARSKRKHCAPASILQTAICPPKSWHSSCSTASKE